MEQTFPLENKNDNQGNQTSIIQQQENINKQDINKQDQNKQHVIQLMDNNLFTDTNEYTIAPFQIVLKNNTEGVAVIPNGSHEYKNLLQNYMSKPNLQNKKALVCAPSILDQEVKCIIQTDNSTNVIEICRTSLQTTIDRFTKIKNNWDKFIEKQSN